MRDLFLTLSRKPLVLSPLPRQQSEEPEPEPEPELPPAAEQHEPGGRHWWQRRRDGDDAVPKPDAPRDALSADDPVPFVDPWEAGFDEPHGAEVEEEDTSEAVLVEEREQGRSRPG